MERIKCAMISLKTVKPATWIRLALLLAALINMALQMFGASTLNLGDEMIEKAVTVALAFVTAIDCYWKNNSFTMAAQTADEILKTIR